MQEYCEVYIYGSLPFKREQNPKIDGMDAYSGIPSNVVSLMTQYMYISKFQLPKMELEQTLTFVDDEANFYTKNTSENRPEYVAYKVRVKETGINQYRWYFYYVVEILWNAKGSIRLKLRMDTLNTFKGLYSISDKSHITREHKNRIKLYGTAITEGGDTFYKCVRYVDKLSEGLSFPMTRENQNPTFLNESGDTKDYALLYRSTSVDKSTGIELYQASSSSTSFVCDVLSVVYDQTALYNLGVSLGLHAGDTFGIFITSYDNYGATIEYIDSGITHTQILTGFDYYHLIYVYMGINASGTEWKYGSFHDDGSSIGVSSSPSLTQVSLTDTYFCRIRSSLYEPMDNPDTSYLTLKQVLAIKSTIPTLSKYGNSFTIEKYQNVDRLDPMYTKMIHIPYNLSPTATTEYNPQIKLNKYKLSSFMANGTKRKITTNQSSPLTKCFTKFRYLTTASMIAQNKISLGSVYYYEGKIYHSDFYYWKISYDTSSIIVKLENYTRGDLHDVFDFSLKLAFNYIVSLNLTSGIIFEFEDLIDSQDRANEDYSYVLVSNRNNEDMLFNNAYIDYVKSGYNYDLQQKDNQLRAQTSSAVIGGLSTTAMTAVGIAGSSTPAGAILTGAITLGALGVNAIKRLREAEVNANNAIAMKQVQLEMQGTTIKSVSDYNLFSQYSKNKLRLDIYSCSYQQDLLDKLFYYYGYKQDRYGTPDDNTRIWWNFTQGDIIFESDNHQIDEIVLEDIKRQYAEGVLTFHEIDQTYDFVQEKENWEVEVYNHVHSYE